MIARSRRGGDRGAAPLPREAFEPRDVLLGGAGIHHQAEEILAEEIDDEVVDDAARLVSMHE
jgi:hypothetical protein